MSKMDHKHDVFTYILQKIIDKYKNYFLAKSNLDIYFSI